MYTLSFKLHAIHLDSAVEVVVFMLFVIWCRLMSPPMSMGKGKCCLRGAETIAPSVPARKKKKQILSSLDVLKKKFLRKM